MKPRASLHSRDHRIGLWSGHSGRTCRWPLCRGVLATHYGVEQVPHVQRIAPSEALGLWTRIEETEFEYWTLRVTPLCDRHARAWAAARGISWNAAVEAWARGAYVYPGP